MTGEASINTATPKPPPRRLNPFNRPAPPPPVNGTSVNNGTGLDIPRSSDGQSFETLQSGKHHSYPYANFDFLSRLMQTRLLSLSN